jgi:ribonuclease HI
MQTFAGFDGGCLKNGSPNSTGSYGFTIVTPVTAYVSGDLVVPLRYIAGPAGLCPDNGSQPKPATNNRAEYLGGIRCMEALVASGITGKLTIVTD